MEKINNVALIGGGVIGAGWAARLLINGIDVTVCDPSDHVERRLNEVVDNALRAYQKLTLAPVARRGSLRFTDSVSDAVRDADFVQESGPERIDIESGDDQSSFPRAAGVSFQLGWRPGKQHRGI